jgi:hypothetical protein
MSIIRSSLLLGAGDAAAGGLQVSRSLRFNSGDSAYLNWTPSVAGNRKIWTWSGWVKRSTFGQKTLFSASPSSQTTLWFDGDVLEWTYYSGGYVARLTTAAVYRDPSAWMHVLFALDTTQATADNRMKLYINGSEVTTFTNRTNPALNAEYDINNSISHRIGSNVLYSVGNFDGFIANCQFIDGQQLTPSSFTEVSATTGQLIPKAYTGTYGTNGFYLKFADNSTTAALGTDSSGNGNTWTTNNFSVTAGAGNDSLLDTPTSYGTDTGVGGEVRGNYCTFNPVGLGGGTLSNGNLDLSTSTPTAAVGTVAMKTGKWYWEITCNTVANPRIGVFNIGASSPTGLGGDANGWCLLNSPSRTYTGSSATSYGTFNPVSGTIVNVAYDADAGKLWFGQDGSYFASGNPATGANASMSSVTGSAIVPAISSGGTDTFSANFGQRAFAYTAPSGFKALCDTNLPTPVVAKPNTLMDVALYTGNGSTQSITGLAFSPDLVWVKCRSQAYGHRLLDTVRGATNALASSSTAAEFVESNGVTAFNSAGFSVGSDASYNENSTTYTSWNWDAGTSTVSNTQGSITSQVRANATAGFSVATWSSGSGGTVGHGLGVAPSLIIAKARTGASSWIVYHSATGVGGYLYLSATNAVGTNIPNVWSPVNSTVFNVDNGLFPTPYNYVSYHFAPVVGYSSFGSYTGNGSADGPFVFCNFRPRWVLIKSSSVAGESWFLFDTSRSPYNVAQEYLQPNSSAAEASAYTIMDILSNGFKLKTSGGGSAFNGSGATYIYAAFAESPFQYARAR